MKFKFFRNKVTCMKRNLQSKWIKTRLDPSISAKKLWKNLKTLGVTKYAENPASNFTANEFNEYFSSSFTHPSCPVDNFDSLSNEKNQFDFEVETSQDVVKVISLIQTNACGHDEISAAFIKKLVPFITPFLTYIINGCITKCYFPREWKIGIIKPIPKRKNPTTVEEFLPISILPCFSLERIMHSQIIKFVDDHDLLYKCQSGFRSDLSTTTAMIKIVNDVAKAIEKNMVTILCCLDFSKPFDIVDHNILINTQFKL